MLVDTSFSKSDGNYLEMESYKPWETLCTEVIVAVYTSINNNNGLLYKFPVVPLPERLITKSSVCGLISSKLTLR